jgi:hypothetical protein
MAYSKIGELFLILILEERCAVLAAVELMNNMPKGELSGGCRRHLVW